MNIHNLQLISRKEVCKLLTINSSTLWRWEQKGDFPQKIILGPSRVAYKLTDIEKWIEDQKI